MALRLTQRRTTYDDAAIADSVRRYQLQFAMSELDADAEERADAARIEERRRYGGSIRAESNGSKRILSGYAAKFNSLSSNLGGFREMLAPGCFSRSIARGNCAMLYNHDPGQVLARCSAGNLDISEDSTGLRFRAELNDTTLAKDVYQNVRDGIVSGMSFGFICNRDKWDEVVDDFDDDDNADDDNIDDDKPRGRVNRRIVLDASLKEISAVLWPAYSSASVEASRMWPSGEMPVEVRSRYHPAVAMSAEDRQLVRSVRLAAARLELIE